MSSFASPNRTVSHKIYGLPPGVPPPPEIYQPLQSKNKNIDKNEIVDDTNIQNTSQTVWRRYPDKDDDIPPPPALQDGSSYLDMCTKAATSRKKIFHYMENLLRGLLFRFCFLIF